jgi:DNA recombination protein RmuC
MIIMISLQQFYPYENNLMLTLILILTLINIAGIACIIKFVTTSNNALAQKIEKINDRKSEMQDFLNKQQHYQQQQREQFDEYRISSLKSQQESLTIAMKDVRQQITQTLNQHSSQVTGKIEALTKTTQQRLKDISLEVDKQLASGFEKTSATFNDIVKRLTIIDQAQKKITELSASVVNLQEVLTDKKSRGAFGEVQLINLVKNMIPDQHYATQYTLSNKKRVDCMLFLPEPTGNLAIDAKFPLENYRKINNKNNSEQQRKKAEAQFKDDIKYHINDIAEKYIIPQETATGAVMFIPAEAIFADIHANYPELIEIAHRRNVWLVSPTTMMAVITTAKAVLKDEATRNQVHLIQDHLIALSKDFTRFQSRMNNLAKHIDQAQADVSLVHKSSQKISSRFNKIEQVDLRIKQETDASVGTQEVERIE